MRKLWLYAIIILMLLLFGATMAAGPLLKLPLGGQDDLLGQVRTLEQLVSQGDWSAAETKAAEAATSWKRIVKRIQFSTERAKISEIGGILARLQGSVKARDPQGAMQEIYYFYEEWNDFGW